MKKDPKKNVCILMPIDLYYRIQVQAEKRSRSVSSYVRQVLKCYLWHEENDPGKLTGEWKVW